MHGFMGAKKTNNWTFALTFINKTKGKYIFDSAALSMFWIYLIMNFLLTGYFKKGIKVYKKKAISILTGIGSLSYSPHRFRIFATKNYYVR